jgi:hypothetical protein
MSYFATLLQRSGVAVGDGGGLAPHGASSAHAEPALADLVGHAPGSEQPAIRELHEERVLPAHEPDSERTFARDMPARVRGATGDINDSLEQRDSRHARVDASSIGQTSTSSRELSSESGDRSDRESRGEPKVSDALDVTMGPHVRIDSDAPFEVSTFGSPIALEAPLPTTDSKGAAMARAMAEVRKWTSQTPTPSEFSLVDDTPLAPAEIPAGIRSIEPRPVASRDSMPPELHVSIGSIEVVVEEAQAAPLPAARTAKSPMSVSASSSSRRLARHHLRG